MQTDWIGRILKFMFAFANLCELYECRADMIDTKAILSIAY